MAITFPLLRVVDDAGAIVSGATVTIASVTDKDGNAIASHGATVNGVDGSNVLAGANVSVQYDPIAKGEAWVELLIAKGGHTFSGLLGSPAFFLAKDSGILAALQASSAPVAATGTVKASPTPTTTEFTLTGVAGSYHAARRTLFVNALAGEPARVTSITPNGSDWDVVLATALSAAPTAGDIATILGFPATASADDTPGTATILSRVTAAVALAGSAPSWYSAFNPATTGVKLRSDAFGAMPDVDGVSFLGQIQVAYCGAVGQLTVPAAGMPGTAHLKTPGGTLVASIPVDGEGNRTGSITVVVDTNLGNP